jgi:hypothetical protein
MGIFYLQEGNTEYQMTIESVFDLINPKASLYQYRTLNWISVTCDSQDKRLKHDKIVHAVHLQTLPSGYIQH